MSEVRYRWIDGVACEESDWQKVEDILATRGNFSLNRWTSRILLAEDSEGIAGFFVFQLVPFTGPLFIRPSARGTGIAEKMSDDMLAFLAEANVRGFITIADSPHSAKLCRERGMTELKSPVFTMGGEG